LKCSFEQIKDDLLAISFNASIEEVARRFKENAARLTEHIAFIDRLSNELGIDKGVLERNERLLKKAEEKLVAYKELTDLQGQALKRLCSIYQMKSPTDTYTLINDTEYSYNLTFSFANLWKDMNNLKTLTNDG